MSSSYTVAAAPTGHRRVIEEIEESRARMHNPVTMLEASLYFAGIARPRVRPEVDLSPMVLYLDAMHQHHQRQAEPEPSLIVLP
jgi:hypothetical protein